MIPSILNVQLWIGWSVALGAILAAGLHGAEINKPAAEARALVDTGISFAAKGAADRAKDFLLRALIYDDHCSDALYELGKIYDAEGDAASAARFFDRAIQEFGREASPANTIKRDEAARRLQKLNPSATELRRLLADYCQELGKIAIRSPDTLTLNAIADRTGALREQELVGAETIAALKLPRSTASAAGAGTVNAVNPAKPPKTDASGPAPARTPKGVTFVPPVNQVPPDVERALKAAGWSSVTGIWKKKSENVYEVTNGKLEADKIDGAIQFVLPKGSDAVIRAFVRNCHSKDEDEPNRPLPATGYGFEIKDNAYTAFVVDISGSGRPVRWYTHDFKGEGKDTVMVKILSDALELSIKGAASGKTNYRATKKAPFMISIEGTAVIEAPQAIGK